MRVVPTATYRLQIQPGFGYGDAAALAGYLADLGVSHAYLSPVLQATEGSEHGYDVVDHARLSQEAGGRTGFDAMTEAMHEAGVGVVVDVVPNHMAVPTPEYLNAPLWSVLTEGEASPYASWFDVDWADGDGRLVMPVLGSTVAQCLAEGQLELAHDGGPGGDQTVVRYFEHELPVRAGTEQLPMESLVRSQFWRLEHWRAAATSLNYRRFFDVTTLIAVRVEDPEVFGATHRLLLDLVGSGAVDGLRIDHPDGLADPAGYLRRLAESTDHAWVVVEKILEGREELPAGWDCAGTTGYDVLWRVGALFVDPAGLEPLTDQLAVTTGQRLTLDEAVTVAKQDVVDAMFQPEIRRLVRRFADVTADMPIAPVADGPAAPPTHDALHRVVSALLVAVDRYRAYVVPGTPADQEATDVLARAHEEASAWLRPEDLPVLDLVRDLVLGRGVSVPSPGSERWAAYADLVTRFQQTCGPVMAKGIEDTAFYRWHRLVGLNEVGADPDHFAVTPTDLTLFAKRLQSDWPLTMTTLSTHDTKRSEDVRARLSVLSRRPLEWSRWLREAQDLARPFRTSPLDGATEYLLWQTLVGAWPIDAERLQAYAQKAVREAKLHTSWTDPDEAYEDAVHEFVEGAVGDDRVCAHLDRWVTDTTAAARAVVLGQKLLQLVLPGVPDVYQGTELVDLSLVDPDNRRLVDYAARKARLARLDSGLEPADLDDEKLLVTSRTLRLRREHPEWFVGRESTVTRVTTGTDHVYGLGRGDETGTHVAALVTRLADHPAQVVAGGDPHVVLRSGDWRDVLTGRVVDGRAPVPLSQLFGGIAGSLPVALLVRESR